VAIAGWLLDKSAAVRASDEGVARQLRALDGPLLVCEIGALEQLYSARSAKDYDELKVELLASFDLVRAPADILEQALELQRDLAHHHGMWHRTPIPDLLIAVTALHHDLGVVHKDRDFERIAKVRPLRSHRLR
jgi:hypothetical protein